MDVVFSDSCSITHLTGAGEAGISEVEDKC